MKAGEEPAASGCGVGVLDGGDTGELVPATAGHLVHTCERGGTGLVRLVWVMGTLLGPEGTTVGLSFGALRRA